MKKIRILLDYGTNPFWLCNEDGIIESHDLPPELSGNQELIYLLDYIDVTYRRFFIDNAYEFTFIGPCTPQEADRFRASCQKAYEIIRRTVGSQYEVTLEIDEKEWHPPGWPNPDCWEYRSDERMFRKKH